MSLLSALRHYFGFSSFRPPQQDIVETILAGQDVLAILPTGAGKSLCFQLPAALLPGTTLVISPLISLMKDQVEHCLAVGITAGYSTSAQSENENQQTLQQFQSGKLKLLYISPEKLSSKKFQSLLKTVSIPLIVIDEAHCISMWGHDFRPSYRSITQVINQLAVRPTIAAFTATATPQTSQDIMQVLHLHQPKQFTTAFTRPNLSLQFFPCIDTFAKALTLLRLLQRHQNQPGIIYTTTRASAEHVVSLINLLLPQVQAGFYHAGMEREQRAAAQLQYQEDSLQVIVATSAFGMGVDKPNTRFVIHYELPASIEEYYQEAGRAGRDGAPAWCYFLSCPGDLQVQQELLTQSCTDVKLQKNHLHKLDLLVKLLQSKRCRQQFISAYFGQPLTSSCGSCDQCLQLPSSVHPLLECVTTSELEHLNSIISIAQQRMPPASSIPIPSERILAQLALLKPTQADELLQLAGVGRGMLRDLPDLFEPLLVQYP